MTSRSRCSASVGSRSSGWNGAMKMPLRMGRSTASVLMVCMDDPPDRLFLCRDRSADSARPPLACSQKYYSALEFPSAGRGRAATLPGLEASGDHSTRKGGRNEHLGEDSRAA